MTGMNPDLAAHLEGGITTTCRCWSLTRHDGVVMGFTDHDGALAFDGITFRADTGLSALALQQSTGLSVDNTDALGALCDAAIREDDIEAGRFDGAEVRAWLVNWADVTQRHLQFRGTIGELRRAGGAFEAELRGLTDTLNRPLGRVYQKPCSAVLGDTACRVILDAPGYSAEVAVLSVEERRVFTFPPLPGFEGGWFQHGRLSVATGNAQGLAGAVKHDSGDADARVIELWHPLRAAIDAGDQVILRAGCDKRATTCRAKFDNLLNFQGFPDIPGDDWTLTDPSKAGDLSGGSRRR
ncbi:DUF2163 domain-containing protein [Roseovarius sp. SCSIO 43702]|uniref:DUF2163 domain-containing protein n=1 Tax=Roseovarius sp. SCSIO 43702 TaxID=2823043 RepID=UPI001C72C4B7|nr:DUF2163 domain-containing protein [Roseovarius sp. SCSIO 43702]QYX56710.1 DUF2163 domain-containing protein [Roseovarius sp. SCSIO 43702]